jgi:hypothetical protein
MGIEKLKALANTAGLKRTTLNRVGSTTKTPTRKAAFLTNPGKKAKMPERLDLISDD